MGVAPLSIDAVAALTVDQVAALLLDDVSDQAGRPISLGMSLGL